MTKKLKTTLLALLGGAPILGLVSVAASCTNDTPGEYVKKDQRVAIIKESPLLTKEVAEKNADKSIVYITDSGRVLDQSFNQSSWEAINLIWDQTDHKTEIRAIQSEGHYEDAYKNALNGGAKYWVLSGFGHGTAIPKYVKANKAKIEKAGITMIFVDFTVNPADMGGFNNYYSLQYKIQEAAWMAAYGMSKYFAEKYPDQTPDIRKFSEFGGGAENGVTDFITGFLKGMISYNATENAKRVTTGEVRLDSGFAPDSKMENVIHSVIQQNGKVILPVAGPATGKVADSLKNIQGNDTLIIGVDVDQALSYKDAAHRFATSIMKNLGQSVYDILLKVVFGVTVPALEKYGDEKTLRLGYAENWVALSKTHVPADKGGDKIQTALDEAKSSFASLSDEDKAYIVSNKATKDGEEIRDQRTLINKLVELVNQ